MIVCGGAAQVIVGDQRLLTSGGQAVVLSRKGYILSWKGKNK